MDRLRELVLQSDPSLLPWLPLIAIAADAEMESTPEVDAVGPEFRRAKVNESVVGFLRAVCPGPTLFAFEDAHLMDEASADLLASLVADDRTDRPWLVAVLRQPGAGRVLRALRCRRRDDRGRPPSPTRRPPGSST